jgi:hypothetical protein
VEAGRGLNNAASGDNCVGRGRDFPDTTSLEDVDVSDITNRSSRRVVHEKVEIDRLKRCRFYVQLARCQNEIDSLQRLELEMTEE